MGRTSKQVDVEMIKKVRVFSEIKDREILSDKKLPFNFLLEGDNLHSLKLLEQWNKVLTSAKATKEYNPNLTYGVYQIYAELDISYKDEETGKTVWVYSDLHGHLQTLKSLVKEYYNTEIVPTLFEYEFLK